MEHDNQALAALFLTPFPGFRLDQVLVGDRVTVMATSIQPTSACPKCGTCSAHIHSRYCRHLTDLPACGTAVTLNLAVRRFVCRELRCDRQIFCERFVDGLPAYRRRSQRALATIQHLSVILGGNAGAALLVIAPKVDTLSQLAVPKTTGVFPRGAHVCFTVPFILNPTSPGNTSVAPAATFFSTRAPWFGSKSPRRLDSVPERVCQASDARNPSGAGCDGHDPGDARC
ncbi:transposase family protein [Deinococcus sp. Arct2-2]|nr:transposase family protein [Deinococcus sp. Arct2-2]